MLVPSFGRSLLFLAVLVVLSVTVAFLHEETGFRREALLDVVPIDDDRLLSLWSLQGRQFPLVELSDVEGTPKWHRALFRYNAHDFENSWVLRFGEQLIISPRGQRPTPLEVGAVPSLGQSFALSFDDGRLRWVEPSLVSPGSRAIVGESLLFQIALSLERRMVVTAREVETGQVAWRWRDRVGGSALGSVWLVEDRLVVSSVNAFYVLDADTGQELLRRSLLGTRPCVVDDALFYSREGRLLVVDLIEMRERALELDFVGEPPFLRFAGHCGRRDGRLILGVNESLVALDAGELEVDWQLEVDVASFARPLGRRTIAADEVEHRPLSSELNRFVPVLMRARATTLAVFDVDDGDLVALSPSSERLSRARLLRHGTHPILVLDDESGGTTVALFDGEQGEWIAARHFSGALNGPMGIRQHHLRRESILLFDVRHWWRVDGRSLAPLSGSSTRQGADVLSRLLDELGISVGGGD